MIQLAIIGCGYGRTVLAPAFAADPRCRVACMVSRDQERAEQAAAEIGCACACSDWRRVTESKSVDAIAVAIPPASQPAIVLSALSEGKAVFAEKPMALTLADAENMTNCALASGKPHMVDFNFTEIRAWKQAKQILSDGTIGAIRHVTVHWQVESRVNAIKLSGWKSSAENGGGTLFNFVSHCFHYLEWFLGPIAGLSSRLFRIPQDQRTGDTTVAVALSFQSGTAGTLSVSTAAYLGTGHRVEFYGENGTLVLQNTNLDYMRGFSVLLGKRPDPCLKPITIADPEEDLFPDARTLPALRLARRFLDWLDKGVPSHPDFQDGLRVQKLLQCALLSNTSGRRIEMAN